MYSPSFNLDAIAVKHAALIFLLAPPARRVLARQNFVDHSLTDKSSIIHFRGRQMARWTAHCPGIVRRHCQLDQPDVRLYEEARRWNSVPESEHGRSGEITLTAEFGWKEKRACEGLFRMPVVVGGARKLISVT
jgi:hypothetical protein